MMRIAKTVTMLALLAALLAGPAGAAQVDVNTDILPGAPVTWTNNNYYNLVGRVYVQPGATLVIEPGTCIVTTTGATQGSLVVCRGAQIFIQGTEMNPVIFTSSRDVFGDGGPYPGWDVLASHPTGRNPKTGQWRGACLEWGSLAILGRGLISASHYAGLPVSPAIGGGNNPKQPTGKAQKRMEGLELGEGGRPDDWTRYGGDDDNDDSGSIHYVSLRYGGRVLALADELNGLSLGGLGRETDIDHVEIMNNVDDGIEIWGGTVNLKYVSIWNIGDDSFDLDEGWRGKAQFGAIVQGYSQDAGQGSGIGDNCFEHDGAEDSDAQPVTTGCIRNFTVIGQPFNPAKSTGDHGTAWRDGCRMQYRNCIFMDLGEQLINNDGSDGDGAQGYGYNGTLPFFDAQNPDIWDTAYTHSHNYGATINPYDNDPVTPGNQEPPAGDFRHPTQLYKAQVDGNLADMKDCVFYLLTYSKANQDIGAVQIYRDKADGATAARLMLSATGPAVLELDVTGGDGVDYTISVATLTGAGFSNTVAGLKAYMDANCPHWHCWVVAPDAQTPFGSLTKPVAWASCLEGVDGQGNFKSNAKTLTYTGDITWHTTSDVVGVTQTVAGVTSGGPGTDNVVAANMPIAARTHGADVNLQTNTFVVKPVIYLDPRARHDALDRSGGDYNCTPPDDGFYTQVPYAGGFSDDTNWLLNWTASYAFGFHGPNTGPEQTNPAQPAATMELKASVVSFPTEPGVRYVVEESTDGHHWEQWLIVDGDGSMKHLSSYGGFSATKLYRVRPL